MAVIAVVWLTPSPTELKTADGCRLEETVVAGASTVEFTVAMVCIIERVSFDFTVAFAEITADTSRVEGLSTTDFDTLVDTVLIMLVEKLVDEVPFAATATELDKSV